MDIKGVGTLFALVVGFHFNGPIIMCCKLPGVFFDSRMPVE